MQRLYRESHYANGTIESEERAGLYQEGRTVKRRRSEVDRAKWKERRNDSDGERGGERITHNLTEG